MACVVSRGRSPCQEGRERDHLIKRNNDLGEIGVYLCCTPPDTGVHVTGQGTGEEADGLY